MPTWTPELDKLLLTTLRAGESYATAAKKISSTTRKKFAPHPSTCLRRARALRYPELEPARSRIRVEPLPSTRVDASTIPPRVRAPIADRLAPPGVLVLALPLAACDEHRDGVDGVLRELLAAVPPGWTWRRAEPTEARADAIASARHQAGRRAHELVVLEDEAPAPPLVAYFSPATTPVTRALLVVVYFSRD